MAIALALVILALGVLKLIHDMGRRDRRAAWWTRFYVSQHRCHNRSCRRSHRARGAR